MRRDFGKCIAVPGAGLYGRRCAKPAYTVFDIAPDDRGLDDPPLLRAPLCAYHAKKLGVDL